MFVAFENCLLEPQKLKTPTKYKEVTSQLRKELPEQIAYLKEMVAVHRGCIAWEAESDESRESE